VPARGGGERKLASGCPERKNEKREEEGVHRGRGRGKEGLVELGGCFPTDIPSHEGGGKREK